MILGYSWFLNNPTGWLMSEKLNGVRAKWDGVRMLNRHGKKDAWVYTNAPASVLAHFPAGVPLEFEIWHGRGNYRETMKLFQATDTERLWQEARFGVFDAPAHGGTIEERVAFIAALGLSAPLFAVEQRPCRGMRDLRKTFHGVFDNDGEGLVLRKAGSAYINGRTTQFLKVKTPW